jgi:uncharacterized membrane protein
VRGGIGRRGGHADRDRRELQPSGGALLFPGPPAGARSFLSAIVQAMISFTAVVFSITTARLNASPGGSRKNIALRCI